MLTQARLLFCCGLALSFLTPGVEAVHAQPRFLSAKQYPGPWLEVTQEVRDLLAVHKVSSCSQAAVRRSAVNPDEYLLYCTQDERRWTSWRVRLAGQKVRGPGKLLEGIPLPDTC